MRDPAEPASRPATDLNVEAGRHLVTGVPAELAATRAAVQATWHEFPYYAARFGRRGWRFSLSDSGWVATLSALPPYEACAQVLWLGGLLAARGMPRYLLERHLEHLHAELAHDATRGNGVPATLRACAAALRRERLAHLPAEAFEALAAGFDHAVAGLSERVENMGVVLVAAVADERAGVANAVTSVTAWALDAARFSAAWRDEAAATIARARAVGR